MNLFDQILSQSKLGTSWQFSWGSSFGSINTQDFQSKLPEVQKKVQAEQNLLWNWYSQKEVNFLKIQKEKGIDPQKSIAFIQKKRQEEKGFASDANRSGFLEQTAWVWADLLWGVVSEVPNFLGNTASFLSKASQYNPMSMIGTAIWAAINPNETYGSIREKQKADAEKLATIWNTIWKKWKELVQSTGLYDPTTTSAKVGEVVTDIGGSLIWPNKVWAITKLGKLAMPVKLAMEGGLAGAKYDVGTKGKITPESVAIWALWNVVTQGVFQWARSLVKSIKTPKVQVPWGLSKSEQEALKIISPELFTPTQLEELKLAWKIKSWMWVTGEKATYIPDKSDIEIAKNANQYLKRWASTSENVSLLKKAIEEEGTALELAIAKQNPIIPKNVVSNHIKKVLNTVMDDPEMVWDNAKIAQNLLNKYKAMVNEEGGTALGILKARKRFDAYIKSVKPKLFDAPTWRAYDTAVKTIRDSANELLDSLVLNKSAKESLRKQFLLYKAREMIASKKDISTFWKILKSPITKWIAWGVAGGAWVWIISNF